MFKRFTSSARHVVVEAQGHQRRLGHRFIGTEHLVLSLLTTDQPAAFPLKAAGLDEAAFVAELRRQLKPTSAQADLELLRRLGIELDDVQRITDETFGPRTLEWARSERTRRPTRRSRLGFRGRQSPSGHSTWAPGAKTALELSLREALRLKSREIRPAHLGLGVLGEGDGLGCLILSRLDVSLDDLHQAWEEMGRPARRVSS